MKVQPVVIEGAKLTREDRRVLKLWCGMSLPKGDVTLKLDRRRFLALQELLEVLGKGRAPGN